MTRKERPQNDRHQLLPDIKGGSAEDKSQPDNPSTFPTYRLFSEYFLQLRVSTGSDSPTARTTIFPSPSINTLVGNAVMA